MYIIYTYLLYWLCIFTLLHVHNNYCTLCIYVHIYRKYIRVEEWICTRSDVHIYFTALHMHSSTRTYFLYKMNTYIVLHVYFFLWTAVQSWLWPWLLVPENSRRHVGSLGFPGTGQRRVFQKNSSPLQGIPKVSIVFVVEERSRPWLLVKTHTVKFFEILHDYGCLEKYWSTCNW